MDSVFWGNLKDFILIGNLQKYETRSWLFSGIVNSFKDKTNETGPSYAHGKDVLHQGLRIVKHNHSLSGKIVDILCGIGFVPTLFPGWGPMECLISKINYFTRRPGIFV